MEGGKEGGRGGREGGEDGRRMDGWAGGYILYKVTCLSR